MNQFSALKRILAILLLFSLIIITLHVLILRQSSKRKEILPRVISQSVTITSIFNNTLEKIILSTSIIRPSKLFFDRVVKWAGDEIIQNDLTYRIPPRIQQVFISNHEYIFDPYRPLIQTILRQHPAFEHWFWFQNDVLSFANQSDFLKVFSTAPSVVFKSDILRYFVIYEFGGVYIDMDFKAHAPLDPLLKNYSCILGREPDPIAYGSRGRRYLISTAFFAMQRHHPFLRLITERLRAKTSFGKNVLTETGPDFMSDRLVEFAALENCTLPTPDAINNNKAVMDFCGGCVLLPWHWAMPAMDAASVYKNKCVYCLSAYY